MEQVPKYCGGFSKGRTPSLGRLTHPALGECGEAPGLWSNTVVLSFYLAAAVLVKLVHKISGELLKPSPFYFQFNCPVPSCLMLLPLFPLPLPANLPFPLPSNPGFAHGALSTVTTGYIISPHTLNSTLVRLKQYCQKHPKTGNASFNSILVRLKPSNRHCP